MHKLFVMASETIEPGVFARVCNKTIGVFLVLYLLAGMTALSHAQKTVSSKEASSQNISLRGDNIETRSAREIKNDPGSNAPSIDPTSNEDRLQQWLEQGMAYRLKQQQFFESIEALYEDGLQFYERGELLLAQEIFRQIQAVVPGYRNTALYLDDIQRRLKALGIKTHQQNNDEESQDR